MFFILGMSKLSDAQNVATPNAGFENWTQVGNHYDPNDWDNLNSNTGILGVFTCTRASGADVHSGTYAIKLTTKSVFGITANGIASTAELITTAPYGVTGGIAYTQRPDSIVGWYKCNPISAADSGFVQFVLLDGANDTVGFVRQYMPNTSVTSYTRFSAPIIYFSSATPVLSYWILSSSNPVTPQVNSSLIIDDIDLIFNPSGISEAGAKSPIQLISNLISDEMQIENKTGKPAQMVIFDSAGRLAFESDVQSGLVRISLNNLNSGIYFYKFDQAGLTVPAYGKLIKL